MLRYFLVLGAVGCSAPPKPSPARVPAPIAKPGGDPDTPCFPGQVLEASAIYNELEKHSAAWYGVDDARWPPARSYGRCTVDRGKVTEADGSLVAEIGCGVRVVRKGIVDETGVQIGARGQDVIDRRAKGLSWAKPMLARCVANGPDQVRCQFEQPEVTDTNPNSYVVSGELDGETVLTGKDALEFFRSREIIEMLVSIWCH